jgi:pyruvate,orthophosphate dikinase
MKLERVLLFDEAAGRDKFLLGGKGYGLAQMTAIGLPVPPGFTVTTEVCKQFYAQGSRIPTGLFDEVKSKVREIEAKTGKRFGDSQNPLLFSVRSGGPFSMPGMMDTILNLGLSDSTADALAKKTGNERFVYDSYRRLIQMFGKVAMGVDGDKFEHELGKLKKKSGAKADIELRPEELRNLAETFKKIVSTETGREFPQDPFEQLEMAVVDLREVDIDPALLAAVPPRLIRRHKIIPLDRKGDVLRVAMADPYDFRAFDALRALFPERIEPVLASERQIRGLIRRHLIR